MPINFAWLFLGHLLKCLANVVSLLCDMSIRVTEIWLRACFFLACILYSILYITCDITALHLGDGAVVWLMMLATSVFPNTSGSADGETTYHPFSTTCSG